MLELLCQVLERAGRRLHREFQGTIQVKHEAGFGVADHVDRGVGPGGRSNQPGDVRRDFYQRFEARHGGPDRHEHRHWKSDQESPADPRDPLLPLSEDRGPTQGDERHAGGQYWKGLSRGEDKPWSGNQQESGPEDRRRKKPCAAPDPDAVLRGQPSFAKAIKCGGRGQREGGEKREDVVGAEHQADESSKG